MSAPKRRASTIQTAYAVTVAAQAKRITPERAAFRSRDVPRP